MKADGNIKTLLEIMARLREPKTGCPWDVEQTFETIAPYTIEEAYEVADAISDRDMDGLRDELGDLLFQVVFHAQMATEKGLFDFNDVVAAVSDKMIRRHPHVFADEDGIETADEQTKAWEDTKARERREKAKEKGHSILDDVPKALPALLRAQKLQKRAGRVGFDWDDPSQVLAKIREEIGELEKEISSDKKSSQEKEELGDLIFALVNLARHLDVDSEDALRATNRKFIRRFRYIEKKLAAGGRDFTDVSLDDLEALWTQAKKNPDQA